MNRILKDLLQYSRSAALRFSRGVPSSQISSRKRLKSSFILIALVSAVAFYGFSAHTAVAYPADEFVTTWKTDNPGTSNATSITVPTIGSGYNYSVDWNNDGVFEQAGITGGVTHDFGSAGTYTIRIKGAFPQIYFNNGGDKSKILHVDQWGSNAWTSMDRAFYGASNLVVGAADIPNLSATTSTSSMFQSATSLGGGSGNWNWNTSTITNMANMFMGTSNFDKDISGWNTSNVTNMSSMFDGASKFNQPIGSWDTSKVTSMSAMFSNASKFNQSIDSWNTANVQTFFRMFIGAAIFNQPLNSWDTSKATNMNGMFSNATAFNQPLNNWQTGLVTDMSIMFRSVLNFNQNINSWNVSSLQNTSGMFNAATSYNSPLNNWNTINLQNTTSMFQGATSFNQPIGSWNMNKVINTGSMFNGASAFDRALNSWNMSNVTDINRMFSNAVKFNQSISNWNTSKVAAFEHAFSGASSFNQDLSSWNVEKVTSATNFLNGTSLSTDNYDKLLAAWSGQNLKPNVIFGASTAKYCQSASQRSSIVATFNWIITDGGSDCSFYNHFVTTWKTDNAGTSNSTSITIPTTGSGYSYQVDWNNDGDFLDGSAETTFNTGNVTHDFGTAGTKTIRIKGTFPRIFFNDGGDKSKILSVEQWGVNSWTSMSGAFWGANNMVINSSDTPNLSGVTDLNNMFRSASTIGGGVGSWDWDTSSITSMNRTFYATPNFDKDIGNWDTANVNNMGYMFQASTIFNQDIGAWNTGNVTDMSIMFQHASKFNKDISGWDTAKVTTMSSMFNSATSFNQPIGTWDTSSVLEMSRMFFNVPAFDQDLSNWDTSKVTGMISMFYNVSNFNSDISGWDTSKVTGMYQMFQNATSFNQDISQWNTSKVTDMRNMFQNSTSFNQNIGSWDVASVAMATNMFASTTLSTNNYDALLAGWNAQTLKPNVSFSGGNSKYCAASASRANMVSSDNWTITDGGEDCSQAKPTDVKLAGSHTKAITENNAVNASMGTLTVTDLTPSDTHAYAFTCTTAGTDDGRFTITGTTLSANQSFDYEIPADADADNAYDICVRVTDSTGNTYDQTLTIAVANVNAAPTGATIDGAGGKSINENNPSGGTIATLATIDDGEDNPETYNYSLDCTTPGADDGLFSTSGTDLKANQSFDYENPADANGDNIYNICIKTTETNGGLSFEQNLTITVLDVDDTPPIIPGAPELTDASDTGSSNTDNLTNDTTPSFKVACSEADATVKIYSNQPTANTLIATHACTSVGNVEVTVDAADALADGIHSIISTETDSSNNVSDPSPALTITIDATASAPPTITPPSNVNELPSQSPVVITGTGVVGETITVISTPDAGGDPSTCTTTVDNDGNYSCSLAPQPELGDHTLAVTTTDLAGNTSTATTGSFTMALDTDGDGQIDTEDTDDDGDGVPDEIEDAGFNNGDGNGDGIKDSLQANVATQFNPVTGGSTTLEVTGGCQLVTGFDIVKESELQKQDSNFTYPVGLNDFSLKCDSPGQSATVTFYYNQSYDTSKWTYKKYDTNTKEYTDISDQVTYGNKQVGGTGVTTVSYQLTDGGPLDQDGLVNGEIADPAGPGVEIPKPASANASEKSDLADTGESTWALMAVATLALLGGGGTAMVLRRKS